LWMFYERDTNSAFGLHGRWNQSHFMSLEGWVLTIPADLSFDEFQIHQLNCGHCFKRIIKFDLFIQMYSTFLRMQSSVPCLTFTQSMPFDKCTSSLRYAQLPHLLNSLSLKHAL
jgi:hypothetical protein